MIWDGLQSCKIFQIFTIQLSWKHLMNPLSNIIGSALLHLYAKCKFWLKCTWSSLFYHFSCKPKSRIIFAKSKAFRRNMKLDFQVQVLWPSKDCSDASMTSGILCHFHFHTLWAGAGINWKVKWATIKKHYTNTAKK